MPRIAKSARLILRRVSSGNEYYYILDRGRQISTGVPKCDQEAAEIALDNYLADKCSAEFARCRGERPAPTIPEVCMEYAERDHISKNDKAALQRTASFFVSHVLGGVTPKDCQNYVNASGSKSTARRDLCVLQAACNYWYQALGQAHMKIVLSKPGKERPRERFLTRDEAAKCLAALYWRKREFGNGATRYVSRHACRAFLIALYTGSRIDVVMKLGWEPLRRYRLDRY